MVSNTVGLEHLAHCAHRRDLEGADNANPRIVNEHIDGATRPKHNRYALGLRYIERHHVQSVRLRQNIFARRSHSGDHVPALRVEVAGGRETVARRATSDEYIVHAVVSFHGLTMGGEPSFCTRLMPLEEQSTRHSATVHLHVLTSWLSAQKSEMTSYRRELGAAQVERRN
ncbi:MAG: PH domain-containing protein [Terracidiphilus sp.]